MAQMCGKENDNLTKCRLYYGGKQGCPDHVCYFSLGNKKRQAVEFRFLLTTENGQYCQHCMHCHQSLEELTQAIESLRSKNLGVTLLKKECVRLQPRMSCKHCKHCAYTLSCFACRYEARDDIDMNSHFFKVHSNVFPNSSPKPTTSLQDVANSNNSDTLPKTVAKINCLDAQNVNLLLQGQGTDVKDSKVLAIIKEQQSNLPVSFKNNHLVDDREEKLQLIVTNLKSETFTKTNEINRLLKRLANAKKNFKMVQKQRDDYKQYYTDMSTTHNNAKLNLEQKNPRKRGRRKRDCE